MSDRTVEALPAATILLLREAPDLEVLMVRRTHEVDFASGALVFPGGKSHADDADEVWAERVTDWSAHEPEQRMLRIAAIREVYEEAGVLLARRRDGGAIGAEACDLETRLAVDAGRLPFIEVVRAQDAELTLDDLVVFSRWITPPTAPKRFDTWFYAAVTPHGQEAVCDGRETVDAEWIAPGVALDLAAVGERTIVFPTRMNLRLLGQAETADAAMGAARGRPWLPVLTRVEERPDGRYLVLSEEYGFGRVEELARR